MKGEARKLEWERLFGESQDFSLDVHGAGSERWG